MIGRFFITAWLVLASACFALAQSVSPVELSGASIKAGPITAQELMSLPQTEIDVRFMTSKGEEKGRYKGVLLWDVLAARGIDRLPGHHPELALTFVAQGADDYRIAYSVGEIAPDFGAKPMLLATERDGKPLATPRLVVPGDKRGARSVKDVVKIEIR